MNTSGTTGLAGLTQRQRDFADALLAVGAVQFGEFRLKLHETQPNAPLSPIYINLRVLRSFPDAMDVAVDALAETISSAGLTFTRYADIPMAATPLVAVLSHNTRIGQITPRGAKSHGLTGTVDGAFQQGDRVLLIDDLVTHADSKIEAARVLEANGLVVHDIAVLIDREQGGREELAKAGYTLHATIRLGQLLNYWHAMGGLYDDMLARVRAYLRQEEQQERSKA